MPNRLASRIAGLLTNQDDAASEPGFSRNTALVTGSVALGAYLTGSVVRWARRSTLRRPEALPPALDADVHTQELMEGQARFYQRDGTGVPLVLLHSFNAAASSFEMQPIFAHMAATTARPLYALEWFGYGLSDRPPVRYHPALYQRQLRRFLSEYLHEPADVVALSLGGEYAALVACEAPVLVRKLALISPTSLADEDRRYLAQRALIGLADGAGAFELFFYRLTRRESLRRFYERQVFLPGVQAPHALVNYAFLTTHVRGAHYAPRRFVDGSIFLGAQARNAYTRLRTPTLLITPEDASSTIQSFDGLAEVVARNEAHLQARTLPAGLLPQWEAPEALFEMLDEFLA